MPTAPTWRRIEAVLIELLREEGFEITQDGGESSVIFYSHPDLDPQVETEINIGDFAKQLEERL